MPNEKLIGMKNLLICLIFEPLLHTLGAEGVLLGIIAGVLVSLSAVCFLQPNNVCNWTKYNPTNGLSIEYIWEWSLAKPTVADEQR